MSTAATIISAIETAQVALSTIQTLLALTKYQYPPTCTPTDGSSWDFIIVGGGSAGCVLAERLSNNGSNSILMIEAGGYAPLESVYPAAFPLIPLSTYDYNMSSVNDNYSAQYLKDSSVSLTQGKMLGGSSALNHLIHVQGNKRDYEEWVNITGDDSWSYDNLLPYFMKMESLLDPEVLNSSTAQYHGTTGPMKLTREPDSANTPILAAFAEAGYDTVLDVSGPVTLGYSEPLYNIADGERQSNALAYLGDALNRTNLCVALSTTVTKILITDSAATGVEMVDASGNTIQATATKETLISAGAIHTPQLLILSGIGPKEQLENLGIDLVADLPVGENFQDHMVAPVLIEMETADTTAVPTNPHIFPVPTTTGYGAVDSSQTYPDYQTINLLFPAASDALLQLCSNVFKFGNTICDAMYAATATRKGLVAVHNLLKPESRGRVYLTSTDYSVAPTVYTGAFNSSSDVTLMGQCLADFAKVVNTTYFQSINATILDPGFCSSATTTAEYWECYAVGMSATMWHYSGTAAMGSVLDSTLKVNGVSGLRVVDSSAMPTVTSGNINAAITVLAEKAAALIMEEWGMD